MPESASWWGEGDGGCLLPGVSALGGCLLPGVSALGGVCSRGVSQHALRQTPSPVNRITDTSKNITLATTSLRPVIIMKLCKNTQSKSDPSQHHAIDLK